MENRKVFVILAAWLVVVLMATAVLAYLEISDQPGTVWTDLVGQNRGLITQLDQRVDQLETLREAYDCQVVNQLFADLDGDLDDDLIVEACVIFNSNDPKQ